MLLNNRKRYKPRCRRLQYYTGVTLMELLIVVALIAIISAFAIPAYNNYVKRADRAQAEAILLENAQAFQTYYNLKNSYEDAPLSTNQSPASGTAKYQIIPQNRSVSSFVLTAVPVINDPECGTLTLSSTGVKGSSGSKDIAYCWR